VLELASDSKANRTVNQNTDNDEDSEAEQEVRPRRTAQNRTPPSTATLQANHRPKPTLLDPEKFNSDAKDIR
jgi:hypothetical protein